MIVLTMEQGSPEWLEARVGVVTASTFGKLLTPKGKPSSQIEGAAYAIAAERISGEPSDQPIDSHWVRRGSELEPHARALYEMTHDVEVEQVGLILRDDREVGCSPDGLVGDRGMLEIKCPSPAKHVEYLEAGTIPEAYRAQVQGQLWVAERDWVDFMSYHPTMPPMVVRVERDEAYIEQLSTAVEALLDRVSSITSAILEAREEIEA